MSHSGTRDGTADDPLIYLWLYHFNFNAETIEFESFESEY